MPTVKDSKLIKIAFFTKRLNLTPGETEKFWPLYNEYRNENKDPA
jgi:hypothetical protein